MTNILKKTIRTTVNVILLLIFLVPFYWMILTSLKTLGQTLKMPPTFWVNSPEWSNYIKAFNVIPFMSMLKNSVIVTSSILVCQAITVIPAAYAFARFRFKGKNILFGITLATMMIPAQLIFLPVFLTLSKLNLINNYLSIILPSATSAFAIFMLRQTFMQIPEELIEAGKLDNAGEIKVLMKIMIPIAIPTLVTLAMLTFINSWNDYFWPFILTTTDEIRTLTVGITSIRKSEGGANFHTLMAGNMMLAAPVLIVFFFAQSKIIKAFTYIGDK